MLKYWNHNFNGDFCVAWRFRFQLHPTTVRAKAIHAQKTDKFDCPVSIPRTVRVRFNTKAEKRELDEYVVVARGLDNSSAQWFAFPMQICFTLYANILQREYNRSSEYQQSMNTKMVTKGSQLLPHKKKFPHIFDSIIIHIDSRLKNE